MKPTDYNIFSFPRNTKGLNTRDTLAGMEPNSSSDLLNIDFDRTGGIRSRRGYSRINAARLTQDNCVGLFDYKQKSGSLDAVGVFDDKIYKMDSFDGIWDDITGAVSLTSSATNYVHFTIGQDTLIGVNGADAPWKWTGSGDAAALSISQFTIARHVTYFRNRLLFSGTTESGTLFPNRIRWSSAGTTETYAAADFTDEAETDDGSEIAGSVKLFDEVYYFKNSYNSGIKKLFYTGNPATPFGLINIGEVGAIGGKSIVYVDSPLLGSGLLYWGVDNKIRFFDGNRSISIADHIQPTLDNLNRTRNQHIQSANYPELNQVWFSTSNGSSTEHNRIIVYDYLNNAFLINDNISANALTILRDTNDKQFLVSGNYAGLTFQHNTGNDDDGSDFDSFYWTAWLDLGNPAIVKKFRWLDTYLADLGSYNLTVAYGFDFMDAAFSSFTINLASGDQTFPFTFPITLGGITVKVIRSIIEGTGQERYIRFKFENNNKDEPFIIYRFDILAKVMGLKDIV